MNQTVKIVNEWAAFEEKHPGSSIADFCRFFLAQNREKEINIVLFQGGVTPLETDQVLLKLVGRIYRIAEIYVKGALKGMGIEKPEAFYFLNYIFYVKNPKKTEVIHANFVELTTGLAILEQLKKSAYIEEKDDADDKRTKRLNITAKGEKLLQNCLPPFQKASDFMFGDLPDEDRQLCIQLLKTVDDKHSDLWQRFKGRPFDEAYKSAVKN
jgi:DNA-binding MarR family transcriptional regulator